MKKVLNYFKDVDSLNGTSYVKTIPLTNLNGLSFM